MTLEDVVARARTDLRKGTTKEALRKGLKRRKKARIIDASPIQESRLNIDDDKVQRFMVDTEAILHDVPAHFVFNIDETWINDYANAKKKQVLVYAKIPGERTQYPVERSAKSSTLIACIAAD